MKRLQQYDPSRSMESAPIPDEGEEENDEIIDLILQSLESDLRTPFHPAVDESSSRDDEYEIHSSEHLSQIDSDYQFFHPLKLKKARYIKPSLPRLLKNDIRRKYPIMFMNMLNSTDFRMTDTFLRTFSHHDQIVFDQYATFPNKAKNLDIPPATYHLSSMEEIIYYFGALQQLTPDMVLKLKKFQIIRRQDCDGSIIQCSADCVATRIYPVHPGMIADCIREKCSSSPSRQSEQRKSKPVMKNDIFHNYIPSDPRTIHKLGLPLLSLPIEREISCIFFLYLDEERRIVRLAMDSQVSGRDLREGEASPILEV
jgi:hypothetical protein